MVVLLEVGEPRCQALNLSDALRCIGQAIVNNNLFCRYHGKQCHGLYKGYKRRNAQLDALEPPRFLRISKSSLASQIFKDIEDDIQLQEIYTYLFEQYVLLCKVIDARRLHHKHFYSLEMDYGHQTYLDKLMSRRQHVASAMENLELRTAEVLYDKERWFGWVRTVQTEEENTREKEKDKVKLEAALFKRHSKEMQNRLNAVRAKEAKEREYAYLDEAWKERMATASEISEQDDAEWDPIEDIVEEDRAKYINLLQHFLWLDINIVSTISADETPADISKITIDDEKLGAAIDIVVDHAKNNTAGDAISIVTVSSPTPIVDEKVNSKQPKKPKNRKKNARSQENKSPVTDAAQALPNPDGKISTSVGMEVKDGKKGKSGKQGNAEPQWT